MDFDEIMELIQNGKQEYKSSQFYNNSMRLPVIYNKLKSLNIELTDALDYGCGRYFDKYELENVKGFDKYSYVKYENLNHHYHEGICSNVLNVIKEREERINILNILHSLCDVVYITVWEGDRSGVGRATQKDCWQENRLYKTYKDELSQVFDFVTSKYKMFICK